MIALFTLHSYVPCTLVLQRICASQRHIEAKVGGMQEGDVVVFAPEVYSDVLVTRFLTTNPAIEVYQTAKGGNLSYSRACDRAHRRELPGLIDSLEAAGRRVHYIDNTHPFLH